ncbi:DUF5688 family protein [[Clostridium] symbiosum]|uniref:DUF5688 family protein n=1 Tax=Clostridium symbiosum TaxID=1512 RepID=UPI0034A215CB
MKQGTFEDVKDRIIYVLENAAAAEKDGRPIPHEDYLEMIKTFRVCRHDGDYDFNVTWDDLKKWGVGLEAVVESANRNSPVLNPPMIYQVACTISGVQPITIGDSMDEILENMADIEDVTFPMYMLTNVSEQYGACSILNESLLGQIADLWEDDIVLLPSSLHEFLMIPYSKSRMDLEEWQETVSTMNGMDFMEDSVLSDSVYRYDRKNQKVVIGYCPK